MFSGGELSVLVYILLEMELKMHFSKIPKKISKIEICIFKQKILK